MVENFKALAERTYREPGTAIEGDKILIWCRKKDKWQKLRGSGQHNCWKTTATKNAFAVINKTFKNLQKFQK